EGVANLKVCGRQPLLNNAVERFMGMPREHIMRIARETLEGNLRGVLATMTPEEVNDDRIKFAKALVHEVEHDMTNLGLTVDTLKIQNVHDEVGYLDSIGRIRGADVIRKARIAEAAAKADASVRAAENNGRETKARVDALIAVAKAEADKRLTETLTQRDALIAEQKATVAEAVAEAEANIDVQKARVEQVRKKLEADIVLPAKADCEAAEARAKADAAPIVQDGKARAEVLNMLAASWRNAGPNARDIFLVQKLEKVIDVLTGLIADTRVQQLTMIDARVPNVTDDSGLPLKALSSLEQIKQIFGVDLLATLKERQLEGAAARPPVPKRG
ncbi:MAG: flotillin family protein, partial [Myxococcales bacterium]|nr:flotillin family protein [Myxococcales bacterium]